MHEDLHKLHHFNYFTIDFNEEFSGLYGGVLFTQSDFTVAALQAIQKLYSEPKKVYSVPKKGHIDGHFKRKLSSIYSFTVYFSMSQCVHMNLMHGFHEYKVFQLSNADVLCRI